MFIITVACLGTRKAGKVWPPKNSIFMDKDFSHNTLCFSFFLFTSWWLDRFSSADLEVLRSIFNLFIGNFQPNKTYTNFPYQCIKLIKFCIFPLNLWSPSPPAPHPFVPTLSFVLNGISSFFGHTVWLVGSQFPGQGLNPGQSTGPLKD